MVLSDTEIIRRIKEEGLIQNAQLENVQTGVISWGVSSAGYDLRCDYHFKVARSLVSPNVRVCSIYDIPDSAIEGYALDPKNPNPSNFDDVYLQSKEVLILHPGEYALVPTIEEINMPRDLLGIVLGKSTYARSLLGINCTPFESEWSGCPTIEIANLGPQSVAIYGGEGICQLVFLTIEGKVLKSYRDKQGKYNFQQAYEMLSKVKTS